MDPESAAALWQFIKYALGGLAATITHIVLFHLLAWKVLPALQPKDHFVRLFSLDVESLTDARRARNSMIDNVGGFLVANMVAYLINIFWVFERGRHGLLAELGLFYAVSGASLFFGTSMMGYLIRRFGMLTTYAYVANIVSAVLINYAARKFFIFKG